MKFLQTALEEAPSSAANPKEKKKKKKMALSKLKMLHWKFWKYKIWLQSKTEP